MAERRELIPGYEAPIYQGVWARVLTLGAPRMWALLWLVGCLVLGLMTLFVRGSVPVLIGLGVLWALGQGLLVWLTLIDPQWDEVALRQLVLRYRGTYGAG